MTTTGSQSPPSGPRSSATPSYTWGARRRLSSTSRSQFRCLAARVRRSTNSKATGFFHAIRRGADGKLKLAPYSEEYKEYLVPAAKLLREALGATRVVGVRDDDERGATQRCEMRPIMLSHWQRVDEDVAAGPDPGHAAKIDVALLVEARPTQEIRTVQGFHAASREIMQHAKRDATRSTASFELPALVGRFVQRSRGSFLL